MIKAIIGAICFAVAFGTIAKFASWFALEWALARYPQEDVISWATLAFGVLVAVFMAGRGYDYFSPDDDEG